MAVPFRENEKLDNNQEFPHIDCWEPTEEDLIAIPDHRTMIIYFNKIFNIEYNLVLNTFNVKRDSYANRLSDFIGKDGSVDKGICHYINYFIKYYDTDRELLTAYLKIKYVLDKKEYTTMRPKEFRNLLCGILYTPSIIEKLTRISEANYIVDLSQDPNDKKEYPKSLQFTNEHAKILMSISYMMKISCPVIYHYIGKLKAPNAVSMYMFYEPLFTLMSPPEINIWNKLYITALAKFNANLSSNKGAWDQIEIFGRGRDNALENLVKEKLVTDNLFKYTYAKSIVNFNSVILEKQLSYYNKEDYGCDLREINNDKAGGGLSSRDKFEMGTNKIDESLLIISRLNIKNTIRKLKKERNIKYTKEEVQFYIDNFKMDQFQISLVGYVFAKDFNGFTDLDIAKAKDYIKLFIILKKDLRDNKGYDTLADIITGIKSNKLAAKTIQNSKVLSMIEDSATWKALMEDKLSALEYIDKSNVVSDMISYILNTTFTYCDYEHPELLGETIDFNKDEVAAELLKLMWFI